MKCFGFKHRPRRKGDTRYGAARGWWAAGAAGTAGTTRVLIFFGDFADGAMGFQHQLKTFLLLLQLFNFPLQARFLILQFVSLL